MAEYIAVEKTKSSNDFSFLSRLNLQFFKSLVKHINIRDTVDTHYLNAKAN